MIKSALNRLYSAVATPFNDDMTVNVPLMVDHCQWQLENGCDGLVVFGSTGEAVSLTKEERMATLTKLVLAGIPADTMLVGTGCCAVGDTVALSKQAYDLGCYGVLVMPPFLFKGLSDEGIQATFRQIIKGVGADDLNVYLYHFPKLSAVPLPASLVNKLKTEFPNNIMGYKDSSGDWENTKDIIENCPGINVYSGTEIPLSKVLTTGGAGCISASANTQPKEIKAIVNAWADGDEVGMERAQALATKNREVLNGYPMAAAVKVSIAAYSGKGTWLTMRPPLMGLSDDVAATLMASLEL
jgi:4-hydroxy-tetrahydrodipicolinate synthase